MHLAEIRKYLSNIYSTNSFVNLLKMKISDISEGRAEILMPVDPDVHTNLYNVAHGGSLASLADTAMGIACATLGKRVVTIEFNINIMRSVAVQPAIKAIGTVIHNGSRTMIVECELHDQEGALVAKARGSFFVIGKFEGV